MNRLQQQVQQSLADWQARNQAPAWNPQQEMADHSAEMQANAMAVMSVMLAFRQHETDKLSTQADTLTKAYLKQMATMHAAETSLIHSVSDQGVGLPEQQAQLQALARSFNAIASSTVLGEEQVRDRRQLAGSRSTDRTTAAAKSIGQKALRAARGGPTSDGTYVGSMVGIASAMAEVATSGTADPHSRLLIAALSGRDPTSGRTLTLSQAALADLTVAAHSPLASRLLALERRPPFVADPNPWLARSLAAAKLDGGSARPSAEVMNGRITANYARLYLANPKVFKWAGIAAYASSKVGDGMRAANQEAAAELDDAPLAAAAGILGAPLPSRLFEALRIGNNAVYMDMYWQHIAYLEEGIEALRTAQAQGYLAPELLSAWEDLDAGRVQFASGNEAGGEALVTAGTIKLAYYEQKTILQAPVFSSYGWEFGWLSRVPTYPGKDEAMASPIPGGGAFPSSLQSSLGSFDDRWKWFQDTILPDWNRFQKQKSSQLDGDMRGLAATSR